MTRRRDSLHAAFRKHRGNFVVSGRRCCGRRRRAASKNRRGQAALEQPARRGIRNGAGAADVAPRSPDEEMPRARRPGRSSWLWPACLCSTAARDEQDTYTVAPAVDNDANMAAVTSPDVDVGGELCTIQMSGGAPFGFRLTDDDQGGLVVGKVRICVVRLLAYLLISDFIISNL